MLRKILNSPWLYFSLAGVLLVAAVASQIRFTEPPLESGSVEDLALLGERDDLNIVFILVDTLRADRMSLYGYPRDTTPRLSELASEGILFQDVESQSSWTKASMASLWTGMYPQRTGVLRFFHAMPDEARMPAEILKDVGIVSPGIWRNGWIAPNFNFGQGFDLYIRPKPVRRPDGLRRHNPSAHALTGTDLDATESAIEFMQANRNSRFFLYIHYMDLHQYLYADISPDFGSSFSDFYDSSLYWTDHNVGLVVTALERLGLREKTLVFVVSDHGEAFFEHGIEGHARNLYREVVQTPFLILPPFALEEGIVVEDRVANVDVWPTILDLAGMPPLPRAEGRSAVPLIQAAAESRGGGVDDERAVFAQLDQTWGQGHNEPKPLFTVLKGSYRLIDQPDEPEEVELYDRSLDPEERNNIAAANPEVVADLRAELDTFLAVEDAGWEQAPEVEIDEMHQNQLRALGYVIERGKKPKPPPAVQAAIAAEERAKAAAAASAEQEGGEGAEKVPSEAPQP